MTARVRATPDSLVTTEHAFASFAIVCGEREHARRAWQLRGMESVLRPPKNGRRFARTAKVCAGLDQPP